MATRLDRLVLLLDTGSTQMVRSTAAKQLGEVQQQHPHELYRLLARILVHLRSKKWETRVAASEAINAVASSVAQWEPAFAVMEGSVLDDESLLTFDTLDMNQVLERGAVLVGSAGVEYDVVDMAGMDPKERLALQKRQLKEKLGFGVQFMDVSFVEDNDLNVVHQSIENKNKVSVAQVVEANFASLSARERNRLKRKAKMAAKDASRPSASHSIDSLSSSLNLKKRRTGEAEVKKEDTAAVVVEHKKDASLLTSGEEWPFEGVCEQLCVDLFSPAWIVRHGAALGLREVLKVHGKGAGKIQGLSHAENMKRHAIWMEDVAVRLLCVLALDRFADYVGDQAMLPVRETCSQTLGVVMQHCDASLCLNVVNKGLLPLIHYTSKNPIETDTHWAVRHSALIGLKYWMAVRQDLLSQVLLVNDSESPVYRAILNGLTDHNDDIRAVSSSSLIPVSGFLIQILSPQIVYKTLVGVLWDCLCDLDDLTSATSHVMDLLSDLISKPEIVSLMRKESSDYFVKLAPQLFPFFRHAILTVRLAVLRTLNTLAALSSTNASATSCNWVTADLMRLIFQNLLLEENPKVLHESLMLWKACCRLLDTYCETHKRTDLLKPLEDVCSVLFGLVMTPLGNPLDERFLVRFASGSAASNATQFGSNISPHDRAMIQQDLIVVSMDTIFDGRISASTALGCLICVIRKHGVQQSSGKLNELLGGYLQSAWACQRLWNSITIQEWANEHVSNKSNAATSLLDKDELALSVWNTCNQLLEQGHSGISVLYRELITGLTKVRNGCDALLQIARSSGIVDIPSLPNLPGSAENSTQDSILGSVFTSDTADYIMNSLYPAYMQALQSDALLELHSRLVVDLKVYNDDQQTWETRVLASLSGTVVTLERLPQKLNPIIRSIMNSVKKEENVPLQERAAKHIANMIRLNSTGDKAESINTKITKNICVFLCSDPTVVGEAKVERANVGISTLRMQELEIAQQDAKEGSAKAAKSKKKKPPVSAAEQHIDMSTSESVAYALHAGSEQQKENMILCRGAEAALKGLAECFGSHLFERVPKLWEIVSVCDVWNKNGRLTPRVDNSIIVDPDSPDTQPLIDSLHVLAALSKFVDRGLHSILLSLVPSVAKCIQANISLTRRLASKCMAALSHYLGVAASRTLIERVLPLANDSNNPMNRQGAVECIYHVASTMGDDVLPYLVFLIIPLLGRMSDSDRDVRFVSTNVFAQLVKLAPLESGVADPEGFTLEMIERKKEERKFIGQLIGTEKVHEFTLNVPINAELRPYQKDGVNWLAFLNRYGLHGILCDDMGLGKTLQSICMMASDHYSRAEKFKKTRSPDVAHCPSLVICPPTLTNHWFYEIKKYAPFMKPIIYGGSITERSRMESSLHKHDIVISSYETVRNNIESLQKIHFNYCTLDEGHIIKNPTTKLTKAIKMVNSFHRLILSGTPIQNNVIELWSLFDFLMPGFLGTQAQFKDRYGKPIQASRDAKASSKEQEKGALALEALHKQVLPFLLRRMKEDVLDDLPPKIIQDYYCELSGLQRLLYEDFARSQARQTVESELQVSQGDAKPAKKPHVFQALQYLRKLCNHPALVLNESHPLTETIKKKLHAERKSIEDIENAPKLEGLHQLLTDCGIGVQSAEDGAGGVVSPHRALIFCQVKGMLDMIETHVFKNRMPGLTYMRLDGTIEASKRQDLVTKFNEDASIDVLLLTTHVGGLGLNLTGADTVIFVEHDWNPMKDLQAMDRAHRIGQTRVVNVYRLITRGTLEEKIMGLQKFKLNIASTVINQDNSGISSMDTNQILDLFNIDNSGESESKAGKSSQEKTSAKNAIENLEALWDESQYDDMEVNAFLKGLQ